MSLCLSTLLLACSSTQTPYDTALQNAEEERRERDFGAEQAAFDIATKEAKTETDLAEARYRRAHSLLREGRTEEGALALEKLARDLPESSRAARSWLDAGRAWQKLGDKKRALLSYRKVFYLYPEFGGAISACKEIIEISLPAGQKDAEAAGLWRTLIGENESAELEEALLYQLGLSLEEHDAREAILTYERLAKSYALPAGKYTDEGLLRAARLRRAQGDFEGSLQTLSILRDQKPSAAIVGSYARPAYVEAFLLSGLIYRDDLKDEIQAKNAFEELARRYPDSRLVDDALWHLAVTEHTSGGDACSALNRLRTQYPGSKFLRCGSAVCPTAEETPKAGASLAHCSLDSSLGKLP